MHAAYFRKNMVNSACFFRTKTSTWIDGTWNGRSSGVTAIHRSIDIILKSNIFECSTSFECRLPNSSSRHTSMQQVSGLTFYLPHFVLFFDCILLIVFQPFSALDVIPFKHQVSITISLVENRFLSFFSTKRTLHNTMEDGERERVQDSKWMPKTVL